MKKLALALACGVAVLGVMPAYAATNTLTLANVGGVHGTYAGVFNEAVSTGSFTDTDTFTLPSPLYNITSVVISSGTSVNLPGFPAQNDIVSLSSVTLDGQTATIAPSIVTSGGITAASYVATFAAPIRAFWVNNLVVTGTAGGASDYRIGVSAVYAVPEPATWAMMIGGFGMIGMALVQRRRRGFAAA